MGRLELSGAALSVLLVVAAASATVHDGTAIGRQSEPQRERGTGRWISPDGRDIRERELGIGHAAQR